MVNTAKKKLTFEQALNKLETIVSAIESNEVTLEESVKLYKEGMELSMFCNESLQAVEKEIVELQQAADGTYNLQPFESRDME